MQGGIIIIFLKSQYIDTIKQICVIFNKIFKIQLIHASLKAEPQLVCCGGVIEMNP